MKARYLHQQHPGHGVTFATGTPISNSLVELYTMQRFLDPEGLRQRGIEHFDAWAANFGEVVEAMEISPDGKTLRVCPEIRRSDKLFKNKALADFEQEYINGEAESLFDGFNR
jgi:N12 class adenine-specific DNA methylase